MLCLICSDPIKHAHIGVNSCRACAVFYRRSASAKRELKCKGGEGQCLNENVKSTCRKCRYERFTEVLQNAGSVTARVGGDPDGSDEDVKSGPVVPHVSRVMDHNSFHECEPSTSQTPQLDSIRKAYSFMCLVRKTAEMSTSYQCAKELEIRRGDLVLVPGQYATYLPYIRIFKEAMIEFGNCAFPEFRALDKETKTHIMHTAYATLNAVDCSYRAGRHFPGQYDMRIPGYTTYLRADELGSFLDNCPDDIDREEVLRTIQRGLGRSILENRSYFEQAKLSDYEVCALLGLALWNDEILAHSDELNRIGASVRQQIIDELQAHYKTIGMGNCAERIGHIFTLLVCFQNHSMTMREDAQVFRLMNLFKKQLELDPRL